MPEITREQVAHLARLSRLALDDDELDGLAAQLDVILGAVAQISQVTDAADVPPTTAPWGRCCGSDRVTRSTLLGSPGSQRPAARLAVGILPAARPGRCPRAAVRPRTTHAPVREDLR